MGGCYTLNIVEIYGIVEIVENLKTFASVEENNWFQSWDSLANRQDAISAIMRESYTLGPSFCCSS